MAPLKGTLVELKEQHILYARGTPMVTVPKKEFHSCDNVWIAHIDTLGFLSAIRGASGNAGEFMDTLFQLPDLILAFQATGLGQPDDIEFWANRYSDTTVIVSLDQSDNGLAPLAQLVGRLLAWAAGTGIPARAGIARGEVWLGDGEFSMASGPALGEAYVAEAEQGWAGGAIHPDSVDDALAESCNTGTPGLLVKATVPIKIDGTEASEERWAVNWPQFLVGPDVEVRERIMYRFAGSRDSDNIKRERAANFWAEMAAHRSGTAVEKVAIALNGNYLEVPFLAPRIDQQPTQD